MKSHFYIIFLLAFMIINTSPAVLAKISVNVSGNENNSTNKVNITHDTSSISTTDVTIDTNGEVKTFHSAGENINWQSPDGKSSVMINNQTDNNSVNVSQKSSSSSKISVKNEVNTTNPGEISRPVIPSPSPSPKSLKTKVKEESQNPLYSFTQKEFGRLNRLFTYFLRKIFG